MKTLVLKRRKFGSFSILFCSLMFPPNIYAGERLALHVPALYVITPHAKMGVRRWKHGYWRDKLILNGETWSVRGFDYRDTTDRLLMHALLDCLDELDI